MDELGSFEHVIYGRGFYNGYNDNHFTSSCKCHPLNGPRGAHSKNGRMGQMHQRRQVLERNWGGGVQMLFDLVEHKKLET